mmetsp:Transcript_59668/g.187059  ORF Transcript_59668/g.187059 Transcript_59668/m.187059 type:complete len:229 (+) Transcript_59668:1883-2569(+)
MVVEARHLQVLLALGGVFGDEDEPPSHAGSLAEECLLDLEMPAVVQHEGEERAVHALVLQRQPPAIECLHRILRTLWCADVDRPDREAQAVLEPLRHPPGACANVDGALDEPGRAALSGRQLEEQRPCHLQAAIGLVTREGRREDPVAVLRARATSRVQPRELRQLPRPPACRTVRPVEGGACTDLPGGEPPRLQARRLPRLVLASGCVPTHDEVLAPPGPELAAPSR